MAEKTGSYRKEAASVKNVPTVGVQEEIGKMPEEPGLGGGMPVLSFRRTGTPPGSPAFILRGSTWSGKGNDAPLNTPEARDDKAVSMRLAWHESLKETWSEYESRRTPGPSPAIKRALSPSVTSPPSSTGPSPSTPASVPPVLLAGNSIASAQANASPQLARAKDVWSPLADRKDALDKTGEEKKDDTLARQPRQSSSPQYKLDLDQLPADAAQVKDSITNIARCVVLGELGGEFKISTIGRSDVKYQGESVYTRLTRYTNKLLLNSPFREIAENAKHGFLKKHEDNPNQLALADQREEGKPKAVDLKRVFPCIKPVFDLVCGPNQHVSECRLPPAMMALLRRIDHELVGALLLRRADQIRADRLLFGTPSQEKIDAYCRHYGWSKSYYAALKCERILTSEHIADYRKNIFGGILFNRCITPFLLYSAKDLEQDSCQRKAVPRPELLKLAEAANKIFKNDYKQFIQTFLSDSDKFLADDVAEKLIKIERSETRIDGVKNSKKPRSSELARRSAPALPQGGDLKRAMAQEREESAREKATSRDTGNYKARRAAAIDVFKSQYPSDFGNEEFAIAFNMALRIWIHEAGEVKIKALARQMQRMHREVKNQCADRGDEKSDGQPELSGPVREASMHAKNGKAPMQAKTPEQAEGRKKQPARKPGLNDAKTQALDAFAKNDKHKAEFQRYPQLRQAMEKHAIGWTVKATGGNFVLALQTIFEAQVIACFFESQAGADDANSISIDQLQAAVTAWKKQSANFGKLVHSADLQQIWDILKSAAPAYKETNNTYTARAAVSRFAQRADVQTEFKDFAMRSAFNSRIKSWLEAGGYSSDPDGTVKSIYQNAFVDHFQKIQEPEKASAKSSIALVDAAMKWCNAHPDQVLSTQVLTGLSVGIALESD